MGDSVSFPQPITASLLPNDATITEGDSATDTDALWGEFDKFYSQNEKMIEKCMQTDVRSLALGERVSDIELQIDTFSETTRVVLDGLAGLGKIHPIIGAAVVAFHAVISLDLSRRDNDRKVITIMLEMQNMMCAMFRLRHLKHSHARESERDTEKTGLHRLIGSITADIMQCGSDLNCYLDQNFAFKLIKAKNFEQRFKAHVENFARRRSELQNTIAVYIAGGIDQANVAITTVSAKLDSVDTKLDYFFHAFLRKLDTPQEKEVFRFFEQNNGVENCISKDELFDRLLKITGDVLPESEVKKGLTPEKRIQKSREVLTDENFEEALRQNTLRFEKLLTVQNNNHERVIAQLEKQEGYHKVTMTQLDKLLYYMHPDTKLNDPEVRRIWERMGLKTSVKAKTFVLTFRDYYQREHSAPPTPSAMATAPSLPLVDGTTSTQSLLLSTNLDQLNPSRPLEDPNAWLLEYIDVVHVRPIVEAVDADGSGFISVKEINTFARARPKDWSLLQWMVYWAAGWNINITQYRNKIYDILMQMHELLPSMHPANRVSVDEYLNTFCIDTIEGILRSTKSVAGSQQSQITTLAQFYADTQENALRKNLEEVSYVISSVADATLIASPARAESWIYPLLYLLLERHLAVLKLGTTQPFNADEIYTHWVSLKSVLGVFEQRKESLTAIFSQIYQNVAGRFETFAYGMFYASYTPDTEITPAKNTLLKVRAIRSTRELVLEMRNKSGVPVVPPDTTILALEKGTPFEFEDLDICESASVKTHLSSNISHPLEGYWSVTCFDSDDLFSYLGLFHFILSVTSDGCITGSGEAYVGKLQLTGTTTPTAEGSTTPSLELKMVFENQNIDFFFNGIHNAERDIVTGSWDIIDRPQESPHALKTFSMRRTPGDVHRFRRNLHLDTETDTSVLAKNRWKFALGATKFQVQTKSFSWEYIRGRFSERRLWLDLTVAFWHKPLPQDRIDLLSALTGEYAPWQSRLYEATAHYLNTRTYRFKIGQNITCDYCGNQIVCNRYRCITCIRDDMNNQIDMCTETPQCIENASSRMQDNLVHSPSHTLLRSSSWLHTIYLPSFLPDCRTRSENIKKRFRMLEEHAKVAKKIAKSSKNGKSGHNSQLEAAANVQPLQCVCCEKEVSLPCWICATCATDTAVCLECELKRAKIVIYDDRDTMHWHEHHLLRINDNAEVKSRDVDNFVLQRELINITTDLRSLEQKVTTHLRAASKVNTVLRRFTLDGEVGRVSAGYDTHSVPAINGEGDVTKTAVAQDTVNEDDDDEMFGSTYPSDTEPEGEVVPGTLPLADPKLQGADNADAEAGGQVDAVAASSSETGVQPIQEVDSVKQGISAMLPIVETSVITPTSLASESVHPESSRNINLSEMTNEYTVSRGLEPELAAVSLEPPAPVSESRQFAHHLTSIDTRIASLETHVSSLGNHIDVRISSLETHISSLGTHTEDRISALDNRLSSLENQLGEILSLLKQKHS